MRAVVVRAGEQRRLELAQISEPAAADGGLLVRVHAFSLNRGEVATALSSDPDGARPGWDFAGTVEHAPESAGFSVGDRVFGLCPGGAWAERIVAPPFLAARIPDGVTYEQAACLPVAGLTAAIALSKRDSLAGRQVLVTGATGGVGLMAVQLAVAAGAKVTALVRGQAGRERLGSFGAEVVTPTELKASEAAFDLVVETVGGQVLGDVLERLATRGVCVLCGNAGGDVTTFDSGRFRHGPGGVYGGTVLYGLFLGEELTHTVPAQRLADLAGKVAAGVLDPVVHRAADWSDVHATATDLLERRFFGKAVLTIS